MLVYIYCRPTDIYKNKYYSLYGLLAHFLIGKLDLHFEIQTVLDKKILSQYLYF